MIAPSEDEYSHSVSEVSINQVHMYMYMFYWFVLFFVYLLRSYICLVCVLCVLFVWSWVVMCLVCLGCLSFLPTSYMASVLFTYTCSSMYIRLCVLICLAMPLSTGDSSTTEG